MLCEAPKSKARNRGGIMGGRFDVMEESFLIAIEDCNRFGVGGDGALHHWECASRNLVGGETKRLDCWRLTLEVRIDSHLSQS